MIIVSKTDLEKLNELEDPRRMRQETSGLYLHFDGFLQLCIGRLLEKKKIRLLI